MPKVLCSKPSPRGAGVFGSREVPLQVSDGVLETRNLLALFLLKMLKLLNEQKKGCHCNLEVRLSIRKDKTTIKAHLRLIFLRLSYFERPVASLLCDWKEKNWYKATKLIYYI